MIGAAGFFLMLLVAGDGAPIDRARALVQQDRIPEALSELKRLLALHAGDPEVEFEAGKLRAMAG